MNYKIKELTAYRYFINEPAANIIHERGREKERGCMCVCVREREEKKLQMKIDKASDL